MFHHQMHHLEGRQKYSAARRIFSFFLGVSSNDETLRLMLDILLQIPGGYSHTLPIRVCAAQRGRDFEAPDLERGIHFRGVF